MSGFLVFDTNRLDDAPNKYSSSADADYPVSNVYDLSRRRRVWRTDGYWKIVSGDNTIVFRESVGVDLTATITADEYTSDTLFFAAVKAALEAAGDSTYTVERDATTSRIKITSNGLGGGGIFQLMWTNAASADMAGILGFSTASDDTGALNYTADLLRIHTEEWLKWDFGFALNPTGFIAVGDRNSPLNISPTATIKLQASSTDSWTSPEEEFTLTYHDYVLAKINTDGIALVNTSGYRYWRLQIIDNDNPDGYIELGCVFLGDHQDLSRGCPEFPLDAQNLDLSRVEFSEAGQAMSSKLPQSQRFSLAWAKLDNASLADLMTVWDSFGLHTQFFIALDNNNAFSSDSRDWIKLVRFEDEPIPRLLSPGNWSYQWNLREAL
jgi:hypothetical protein